MVTDDEVLTALARVYAAAAIVWDADGDGEVYAEAGDGARHRLADPVLNELVRRELVEVRELAGELHFDLTRRGNYLGGRRVREEQKQQRRGR